MSICSREYFQNIYLVWYMFSWLLQLRYMICNKCHLQVVLATHNILLSNEYKGLLLGCRNQVTWSVKQGSDTRFLWGTLFPYRIWWLKNRGGEGWRGVAAGWIGELVFYLFYWSVLYHILWPSFYWEIEDVYGIP